ncbi:MAG: alpha/beta hydrolase [Gammaproteobacteria bacterium]|jgi:pimeloyl-ACP methyl ester carboxylesterase|nr:alpha/beta hydrolase [Gammaproteobacteria bacterium]
MKRGVLLVVATLAVIAAWTIWSESNPRSERELRIEIQQRLGEWFPESMAPPAGAAGFAGPLDRPEVILVHGVDEPGGIWSRLQTRLDAEGIEHVEFRYPNDQAIDDSADELAAHWSRLEPGTPIFLVGHSMGGLVIRDFVSRHRHPVASPATVEGPHVGGVILVGTPNHGSEWARLRAWLEIREYAADIPAGRFSLFAALRDGTGAAKVDLRPGSGFLRRLNARSWPAEIPLRIIGGRITEPTPRMRQELRSLSERLGLPRLQTTIEALWTGTGDTIGDGAVPVDSLPLDHAPPPLILPASHRGLIARMPLSDRVPPAIDPIIRFLKDWGTRPDDGQERTSFAP